MATPARDSVQASQCADSNARRRNRPAACENVDAPMTKMQSAGNGLKLNEAAAGGVMAPRLRPDAWAAGVDSHVRTVRDSRSIPRAPPIQKRTAIEMCCTLRRTEGGV